MSSAAVDVVRITDGAIEVETHQPSQLSGEPAGRGRAHAQAESAVL